MTRVQQQLWGQIFRFLIAGGIVTLVSISVYSLSVYGLGAQPLTANLLGYLVAVHLGFRIHRGWSFRETRSDVDETAANGRFFLVSLASLGLNAFWIWVLTIWCQGPEWWPIVPMAVVTPICVFALNRLWVFRPA